MKSTPSLPSTNRFAVLSVDSIDSVQSSAASEPEDVSTPPSSFSPRTRRPGWEQRLPRKPVISTLSPSEQSLYLQVNLETTDTAEHHSVRALVDSGATGMFIDRDYARTRGFTTRPLMHPIPVRNVDGTLNEAGSISEVVDTLLRFKGHTERALLAVTKLGTQCVLLGYSWLHEHNPEVDWQTGEVKMSRCPRRCMTCRDEARVERKEKQGAEARISACRAGPFPVFVEEVDKEDEADAYEGVEELFAAEDPEIEDGDRIWVAGLPPPPEDIRATITRSQQLAEEAHRILSHTRDSRDSALEGRIPSYLHDYNSVFAKEAFDELLEHRQWDHAIELRPGAESTNTKVYPLSPREQKELDIFLHENLTSGRIQPSKSPMASPVFFMKKKDGSLCLIQDYRALNAMTVKNKYPLPLIPELIRQLHGAHYFTKLDIRWGYNNICVHPGDEWKAAFHTNRGLFEPLVMFFGLTNSPVTFQMMMNDIFRDLIMKGVVVVYMDDILIFTRM